MKLSAALFALLTLGVLAAYLLAADEPNAAITIALIVVFGILAARSSGLRRSKTEVDPAAGHLSHETEFEGPADGEG